MSLCSLSPKTTSTDLTFQNKDNIFFLLDVLRIIYETNDYGPELLVKFSPNPARTRKKCNGNVE